MPRDPGVSTERTQAGLSRTTPVRCILPAGTIAVRSGKRARLVPEGRHVLLQASYLRGEGANRAEQLVRLLLRGLA